jgi:hypothetical protein
MIIDANKEQSKKRHEKAKVSRGTIQLAMGEAFLDKNDNESRFCVGGQLEQIV